MTEAVIFTARVALSGDILDDAALISSIRPAFEEFKTSLVTAGVKEDAVSCRHDFGTPAAPAVEVAARKKRGPNKPRVPVEAANGAVEHAAGE